MNCVICSPHCLLQASPQLQASRSGSNLYQLRVNHFLFLRASSSRSFPSRLQCDDRTRLVRAGGADGRKAGFGPQPVKKSKKGDRLQRPRQENDPVNQAQQILAEKQEGKQDTGVVQAPWLDSEFVVEKKVDPGDEKLFEERLAAIRRSAEEKRELEKQKKYLPIDYDAPPPTATEMKWTDSITARIGAGVAVLVFGAIFALGDFLPSGSPSGDSGKQIEQKQLPPEEAARLMAQVEKFEETLKSAPEDPDALEGAGVTYAELGEYSKSAAYLTKLVQKAPNDVEAQRLLGEVRYEAGDYAGSAAAYRSAVGDKEHLVSLKNLLVLTLCCLASPRESVSILQGLMSALLADSKPNEAVGEMLAARARLDEKNQQESLVQRTTSSESRSEANSSSSQNDDGIDPVQVEMLLGKSYSAWQGHSGDAVAVYDALISNHPDDFRGYLAKAILLKDQGKIGDAERMFIQARYLAPPKAKALVDRYSGR